MVDCSWGRAGRVRLPLVWRQAPDADVPDGTRCGRGNGTRCGRGIWEHLKPARADSAVGSVQGATAPCVVVSPKQ